MMRSPPRAGSNISDDGEGGDDKTKSDGERKQLAELVERASKTAAASLVH
jgi:hypothetical protein